MSPHKKNYWLNEKLRGKVCWSSGFKKYNKRCFLLSYYKHSACSTSSIDNYLWASSSIIYNKKSWGFQFFWVYCWNISVYVEDPPSPSNRYCDKHSQQDRLAKQKMKGISKWNTGSRLGCCINEINCLVVVFLVKKYEQLIE